MKDQSLAVYLVETGRTDKTNRVDILTPRDENGDEMVVSVDCESITISRLSGTVVTDLKRILLEEV